MPRETDVGVVFERPTSETLLTDCGVNTVRPDNETERRRRPIVELNDDIARSFVDSLRGRTHPNPIVGNLFPKCRMEIASVDGQ